MATTAQISLIRKLAGGLSEAGAAAVAAGLLDRTGSNKRDRENALASLSTAEASQLISSLGGRPLAPRTATVCGVAQGSYPAGDCQCGHCQTGNESLCRRG